MKNILKTILTLLLITSAPITAFANTEGGQTILQGGNGWKSSTVGDMYYGTSSTLRYSVLPIGTTGQILGVVGGVPAWIASTTAGIVNFFSNSGANTSLITGSILNVGSLNSTTTASSSFLGPTGFGTTTPDSPVSVYAVDGGNAIKIMGIGNSNNYSQLTTLGTNFSRGSGSNGNYTFNTANSGSFGANGGNWVFSSLGVESARISAAGNLCVATSSCTNKLTVNGNAFVTGNVTATNVIATSTLTGGTVNTTSSTGTSTFGGPTSGINQTNLTSSGMERYTYGQYNTPHWRSQLSSLKYGTTTQQAIVNIIGDSWTANTIYSQNLRNQLVARYGDAGCGYLTLYYYPFISNQNGSCATMSTGGSVWTAQRNIAGVTGLTVSDLTSPNDLTSYVQITGAANTFVIYYTIKPGGGILSYAVNGAASSTVDTSGVATSTGQVTLTGTNAAADFIKMGITSFGTTGVTLEGVEMRKTGAGVRLNSLGMGGSTASNWISMNQPNWNAQFASTTPNLTIILLGTNDINGNTSTSTFSANMTTLISNVRTSSPNTDIVLVSPADNFNTFSGGVSYTIPQYSNVLQDISRQGSYGFIDLYKVLGNYGISTSTCAYADTVHPTAYCGQAFADVIASFLSIPGVSLDFDSNGRIGIGTTSPVSPLSVVGTDGNAIVTLSGSVSPFPTLALSTIGLTMSRTASGANFGINTSGTYNGTNGGITFNPISSEAARFTGAGLFGIGTTTPFSPFDLYKTGEAMRVGQAGNAVSMTMAPIAGSTGGRAIFGFSTNSFGPDNGHAYVQGGNGKGIGFMTQSNTPATPGANYVAYMNELQNTSFGTTSPYAKLSIQQAFGNTNYLLDIASTTSSSFATSSIFTVLPNGNIGIGTSSPVGTGVGRRALILQDTTNEVEMDLQGSGTLATWFVNSTGMGFFNRSNTNLSFGTNNTERMRIDSNGLAGFGTSTMIGDFQVTNLSANATTTIEFGKKGQNKGTCLKMYDATGVAWYYTPAPVTGALTASATACASVSGF